MNGRRILAAASLLTAVVVSGALSVGLLLRLPRQLHVSTDIVGYPIFAAYNPDRLKDAYYIGVLFFPITALVLYLGLRRVLSLFRGEGRGERGGERGEERGEEGVRRRGDGIGRAADETAATRWARVLAVGAVYGLGAAVTFDFAGGMFWVCLAAVAAAYAALVAGACVLVKRPMAWLNALAAPLTFLGVVGASAVTQVTVLSDGSAHHYPWLPLWAGIVITAAIFGWVFFHLARTNGEPAIRALEKRALLFVAFPVCLFLLFSNLPGAAVPMDMFHDGESLAASRLTLAGYFPWRDLMSIHGLFQDALSPLVGMRLVENTRWGAEAGKAVLLDPLSYIFLVGLIAWLLRRSWVLVVAFSALILGGKFLPLVGSRFIFLPLVLLLLAVALDRRRWWLGVALGCSLAVQAILVPETAFAIVACGLIVILHDFYHRQPGARLVDAFSLTAWCVAGGSVVIAGFVLVLLSQHALGDFLFYFSLFAPNRGLAGGVPLALAPVDLRHFDLHTLDVLSKERTYLFFALSTPAILLLAFLYYSVSVIRRRRLDTADWVVGAVAIFSLLYYTKFLERADPGHATQVYAEAVPLIAFAVYRVTTYVDGALARWRVGARSVSVLGWQPAAVAVLLIVLFELPGHTVLPARLAATPDHFRPVVSEPSQINGLGYVQDGIDRDTYTDIGTVLKAYLRPGDWVFDFSNEPGLYYYLLGRNPRTRYYHVSMAIPEVGQKDLIGQLARDQPKLVVFTNNRYGLPEWDGIPNMVRHYDVSQYILENYTPLLSTHTQVFYGLTSAHLSPATVSSLQLSEPAVTDGVDFLSPACDWGYAPNFLSISPPPSKRARAPITVATTIGDVGTVRVSGWAVDMEAGAPAARVVLVANGELIGQGVPAADRPDVARALGKPGAVRSGFAISATIPAGVLSMSSGAPYIQVFGVSASGVASEVGLSPGARNGQNVSTSPPIAALRLPGGTVVPIRAASGFGVIEWIGAPRYQLVVSPPPGGTWADYSWLEIDAGAGFREDAWSLTDGGGDSGHDIMFSTSNSSPSRYRVHVGSCAQWHGYTPKSLFLGHGNVQDIASVRLLP